MALGGLPLNGHNDMQLPTGTPSLDMAIVGNSSFNCIVDKTSKVVWACFPKIDGDPIFNCLLNNNSSVSQSASNLRRVTDVPRVF